MRRLARRLFTLCSAMSFGLVLLVTAAAIAHWSGWRITTTADAILLDDYPAISHRDEGTWAVYRHRKASHAQKTNELRAEYRRLVDAERDETWEERESDETWDEGWNKRQSA